MQLAIRGGKPVCPPSFDRWPIWGREEEEALLRALHSGKWGALHGEEVKKFEKEFAGFQGADHAVAVNSGTAALQVALRAAGIPAGAEVILPAYTFVASATAILDNCAIPVFVDIDPETYTIDPQAVEAAINENTAAIMPVHFAGRPADMDALEKIAADHELILIEDAAQAWGASWRGRGVGSTGFAGGFSFQSSKNINAGEGGIILTSEEETIGLLRSFSNCGRLESGLWYAHYNNGGNYRMTEFQGALLREQLRRYPRQLERRQQNCALLNEKLAHLPGISPLPVDSRITSHACHLYIFRYSPSAFDMLAKDQFVKALQAEGVPCSGGYSLPLYEQPLFRNRNFGPFSEVMQAAPNYAEQDLPHTRSACQEQAVWIRQSALLAPEEDILRIVSAIEKIYENRHELL